MADVELTRSSATRSSAVRSALHVAGIYLAARLVTTLFLKEGGTASLNPERVGGEPHPSKGLVTGVAPLADSPRTAQG